MGRFATGSLRRRIRARRDARAKKRYAGGMWTCRGSIRKSPSTNPSWPRGDPTRGEDRAIFVFPSDARANRRDDTHAAFVASRSRATLTSHQSRRTHRQTTLVVVASLLALAALAPALGLGTVGALVRGDSGRSAPFPTASATPGGSSGVFPAEVSGWRTPETSANAGGRRLLASTSCAGDASTDARWISSRGGWVLYALAILYLFLGVAIVCDDFFTASLERICLRLRLSEDVAGATFMAAGSSAPELFTSTMSLVSSNATNELGVATIVGSAVFNILVIVAATTVFSTKKNEPLRLDWKPVTRDCAFYAAAVASVLLVMADGKVWWWEGVACVCMYATYVAFMAVNEKVMRSMDAWAERRRLARRDKNAFFFSRVANAQANLFAKKKNKVGAEALSPERPTGVVEAADDVEAARDATRPTRLGGEDDAIEHTVSAALEATVADLEREEETRYAAVSELLKKAPPFSRDDARDTRDAALDETCASAGGPFTRPAAARDVPLWLLSLPWYLAFTYTIPDCEHPRRARGNAYLVSFGASVAWISAISYGMVDCASRVGCALDIPEVVMGTLVLAAGTSVPDALASVSVARGGAGDMAVANAVGSNVFDIWLGLGLPWAAFLPTRGNGDPRAMFEPVSVTQLWPSVCILAGVLLVYYASVAASGFALTKSHGYFFLFVYFLFAAYSVFGVWWLDVYELRSGTEAA